MGSEGCCRIHVIKAVLHAYQFVFLLSGLAICGVGIWLYLKTFHYMNVANSANNFVAINLFLVTGALVILTFCIGCCAIPKHRSKLLFCYILLLVLVFLMEALVGLLSYIYQEGTEDALQEILNSTFLHTYEQFDDKTKSIDYVQQNSKCCGSESFFDWRYSFWLNNQSIPNLVPDSCCKTYIYECGKRDHPSNIYYAGCFDKISHKIQFCLWIICAVSLGVSVLQVVGVPLSIKLFLKLEAADLDYTPNTINGNENLIPDKYN